MAISVLTRPAGQPARNMAVILFCTAPAAPQYSSQISVGLLYVEDKLIGLLGISLTFIIYLILD